MFLPPYIFAKHQLMACLALPVFAFSFRQCLTFHRLAGDMASIIVQPYPVIQCLPTAPAVFATHRCRRIVLPLNWVLATVVITEDGVVFEVRQIPDPTCDTQQPGLLPDRLIKKYALYQAAYLEQTGFLLAR